MRARIGRSLTACALMIGFAAHAAGAVVVLSPVSDAAGTDQTGDGVFESFFPSNSVYLVGNINNAQYRSVLEFSLAGIPTGATITSAKLQLSAVASINGTSAVIFSNLYAGNGIAEVSDLTTNGALVGPLLVNLDDHPQIDFTSAFQTLYSSGAQNAGFNLFGAGFLEFASRNYSIAELRPTLTLTFTPVPEPSSLILLCLGIGLLFAHRRVAR